MIKFLLKLIKEYFLEKKYIKELPSNIKKYKSLCDNNIGIKIYTGDVYMNDYIEINIYTKSKYISCLIWEKSFCNNNKSIYSVEITEIVNNPILFKKIISLNNTLKNTDKFFNNINQIEIINYLTNELSKRNVQENFIIDDKLLPELLFNFNKN